MKKDREPLLTETRTLLETPYINVYDLVYEDGLHYYDASRRRREDPAAYGKEVLPDAVGAFVILTGKDGPRILLFHEYRYPAGRYVLSIPSGLIDEDDRKEADPVRSALIRELKEETGIIVTENDDVRLVCPLVFNTPGMSDESTALVSCVIRTEEEGRLSHDGAEGSERFEGFDLVTRQEASEILAAGKDRDGNPYPLVTWAALMYFLSDMWR